MKTDLEILILNPPSPPYLDVSRDWAGGFGTARSVKQRTDYGHSGDTILYPFLPYAAGALSHENYSYNILDCQRLKLGKLKVLEKVKKQNPNVIFSLISLPSLSGDVKLLNEIKEALPDVFVVGVGTTCRFLNVNILTDSKVDAVLKNDYPYVWGLDDFLHAVESGHGLEKVPNISYSMDGKIMETTSAPNPDLAKLAPPRYDDIELDGYEKFDDLDGKRYSYIPIVGSKGCPFPCDYCPYPLGLGKKWTRRSPKSIVDEIAVLHARGVQGFLFRDQSFLMSKEHATQICREITDRQLDIAWFCEARVDQVSEELLNLMSRAGCKQIHYGVETGDPNLLGQGKPQTDLTTIMRAFRLTKRAGLWTTAHVILGWPDETYESLEKTAKVIEEITPDEVNWSTLTPYPGTQLRKIAEEENLILTNDWSEYTSHTVVMRTRHLSAQQLNVAKDRIIRDYYKKRVFKLLLQSGNRPRFVLNQIAKTIKGRFI